MKNTALASILALTMLSGLAACRVTQTEEGDLPDVEVDVEGGNLPKYDVDAPDVDVGTKEVTVEVPDVEVKKPGDPGYEDDDPNRSVNDPDDDGQNQ